jgi:hypothetical protein
VFRFSGQAEYSTTLQLSEKVKDDYILDLGVVRESARVWVNGKDTDNLWHVPLKVRLVNILNKAGIL